MTITYDISAERMGYLLMNAKFTDNALDTADFEQFDIRHRLSGYGPITCRHYYG